MADISLHFSSKAPLAGTYGSVTINSTTQGGTYVGTFNVTVDY